MLAKQMDRLAAPLLQQRLHCSHIGYKELVYDVTLATSYNHILMPCLAWQQVHMSCTCGKHLEYFTSSCDKVASAG